MTKRDVWLVLFGLIFGLLGTGLLLLAIRQPRGNPVQLSSPPTPAPLLIHISGGVVRPGVYKLPLESRLQDAVQAAGGLLASADSSMLNLAARLKDGERLIIPILAPTQPPKAVQTTTDGARLMVIPTAAPQPTENGKININTASVDELDRLPGIGPVTAQKILDFRQQNGPFQTVEAIMDVSGIGPATYEDLKDLITVGFIP